MYALAAHVVNDIIIMYMYMNVYHDVLLFWNNGLISCVLTLCIPIVTRICLLLEFDKATPCLHRWTTETRLLLIRVPGQRKGKAITSTASITNIDTGAMIGGWVAAAALSLSLSLSLPPSPYLSLIFLTLSSPCSSDWP